eukprot:gene12300-15456_t
MTKEDNLCAKKRKKDRLHQVFSAAKDNVIRVEELEKQVEQLEVEKQKNLRERNDILEENKVLKGMLYIANEECSNAQEEHTKELEDAMHLKPSVDPDYAYDKNNILELAQLIMFYVKDYQGCDADRDSKGLWGQMAYNYAYAKNNILELAQLIMFYVKDYEGCDADRDR